MTSRNNDSNESSRRQPSNPIRDILQRNNFVNYPLNRYESNMQEQIINFFPNVSNLTSIPIVVSTIDIGMTNVSTNTNNEISSNSSLNPLAEQFIPMSHQISQVSDTLLLQETIIGGSALQNYENNLEQSNSSNNTALEIPEYQGNTIYTTLMSIFNIRNPPSPSYKPIFLIEKFKNIELGISKIEYPYEDSIMTIYLPSIITIDNPFCKLLIRNQIINLKDILKDKEAAIQIAYFIKTGEITEEVQPHHDELSGYSKKPLSKKSMKNLKYKNIKDISILETMDESSNCSICQTSIKELIESNQEIIVLECGDYFCKDCIFQWLEQYQNKCPNCNKVLSCKEDETRPISTQEDIFENNYYKAAYFIIRYCNYYLQKQDIRIQRLDQLNELFIQQKGLVSMDDCKKLLNYTGAGSSK